MDSEQIVYEGRIIAKAHFRVYVYSADGAKLLVNNWNQYKEKISSGLWFAKIEDIKAPVVEEKNTKNPDWMIQKDELTKELTPKKIQGRPKKGGE